MNRSELVQHVAEQTGLNRTTADQAVDAFVEAVMSATKKGEKVQLFGFGTFTPTARAARMGRNPQTGDPVKIAASKGVRFAPASVFKSALNSKGGAKATAKKATAKKTSGAKKAGTARKAASKSTAKKSTSPRAAKKTARKR